MGTCPRPEADTKQTASRREPRSVAWNERPEVRWAQVSRKAGRQAGASSR